MRSGELEAFISKWRAAIRAKGDSWEGTWAVGELVLARYPIRSSPFEVAHRRSSAMTFVCCDQGQGWRPTEMLTKVFAEVTDYKRRKLDWQKEFRITEMFLDKIYRATSRQKVRVKDSRLKRLLANTAAMIEKRRVALKLFRDSNQSSPLGVWERLWPEHARKEIVSREIDLDTRLQLQVAKMFRTFLGRDDGVSLRTIARLVVLVYEVADLASETDNDGFLRTPDSNRKITTRSVEEKLRRKGMR